jgi:phage tail sheath protein FI
VTVFVGYTNPFWKLSDGSAAPFDQAVSIMSFSDYETQFGGFFSSPNLPDYVGHALFQFFQNGGSTAYVVSITPTHYFDYTQANPDTGVAVAAATVQMGTNANNFTFTALQPVGNPKMTIRVSNVATTSAPDDTADLTIEYGSSVETYRGVQISKLMDAFANGASRLVTVAQTGTLNKFTQGPTDFAYGTAPGAGTVSIDYTKFGGVFADDAPLDKVPIFNLMLMPGITRSDVLAMALAYCERKRAFYIMDPPANAVADTAAKTMPGHPAAASEMHTIFTTVATAPPQSANGAIYFPYLNTTDPVTGNAAISPPSGFVAGIFAREDVNRGVWKSPAGLETTILGTTGVVSYGVLTDPRQGQLNNDGVNCIRSFPGMGTVVFGSRTLVSANPAYEQWKYVAVRRMALFLEQSLYAALKWAVHEPNDEPLWTALTHQVKGFMLSLYRQGAFQGETADQAFQVLCDSTTTTQTDIDLGVVNILVSFAPLKPAEFVVVKIAQLAGQSQS